MSLIVWLPLLGNTNNQGLSNQSFSVSNTSYITVDNNGKLGKCYNFNSSATNNGIFSADGGFMANYINNKSWSLCAWVNTTATDTCVISLSYGLRMFAGDSSHTYITLYNSSRTINCSSSTAVNDGKWHHLCATYDVITNAIKFYVDGVNTGSNTYTSGYAYASSWANGLYIGKDPNNSSVNDHYLFKGKMDDVRIYSGEALSQKQIKLISQGLVAHYKLTGALDGINPNLFKATPKSYNPTAYNAYQFDLTENLVANETYTMQLWDVDVSHSAKTESQLGVWVYWGGGSVVLFNWSGTSAFTNGHADYLVKTFTVTSAQAGGSGATNLYLNFYNSTNYVAGTMNMSIGKWKLEKGSVATPYTKTAEEMGIDDSVGYDCSGYNYHGTKSGTLTVNNDTPRYSVSTQFSSGSHIRMPAITMSGFANSYTFAWWAKIVNYTTTMMWGFNDGNRLNLFMYNNCFYLNTGDGGSNPFGTISPSDYAGIWHHFVITGDGTTTRLYIDGSFITNSKTYKGLTGTVIYMNGWDSGSSYCFNGALSDFRIYATALSADDVLELYQTGQSISNNKTLFAYEFKEPENGELMNTDFCNPYGNHDPAAYPFTNYNSDGEPIFTANRASMGSGYIPINPTGKTYYYDMLLSINAGNKFYVGFERYDKDFTPRSNQACVYVYATKPTSDVVKVRYRGTVNLSTDGVNPCAYIALRILNGWSGTTSGVTGTATIHYLSLREVATATGFHTSFGKNGVATTDLFLEKNGNGDIEKTGIINMINFIET